MAIVYVATSSVSGLPYVGFTKGALERRKRQHESAALRGSSYGDFARALAEQGCHSFFWRVEAEHPSEPVALALEKETIARLGTLAQVANIRVLSRLGARYRDLAIWFEVSPKTAWDAANARNAYVNR